ncbi:MAG: CrcB family protein [Aquisalimonadaceae bacterium]
MSLSLTDITVLHLALIGLGGALGGAGRFWVLGAVSSRVGDAFPWGTLVVNVTGAAAVGMLAAWLQPRGASEAVLLSLSAGLIVGIVGSYTTVSAFSLQTLVLLRATEWRRALSYIGASLCLCLASAAAGYAGILWLAGR